jgi:N-acetylglucosaminyl-diphospho-decaprenol L-rhamnosyltransferase
MAFLRNESRSRRTAGLTPFAAVQPAVLRVIIVNYRQWKSTWSLIASLQKCQAYRKGDVEIVVVDNNSPPHAFERRLEGLHRVKVIRSRKNRGFAKGVNAGAEGSQANWILLLNPDISVGDGFLDQILASGTQLRGLDSRLGVVGFGMLDPEGSVQPSTGPFPTFCNTILRLILPRRFRKYDLVANQGGQVAWASGCCLLISRECWQALECFDRDYFLYYEDVDFCRRATAQGWKVVQDRGVTAVHHHPLHRRKVPPHLRVATRMALHTYARKHWSKVPFALISLVLLSEAMLFQISARLRGNWGLEAWWASLGQLIRDASFGKPAKATRRLFSLLGSGDLHRKG